MKKFIIVGVIILLAFGVFWNVFSNNGKLGLNSGMSQASPLDATYNIDGADIQLVAGKNESALAPGSASKQITSVFGQPTLGDLNGDNVNDAVMFATVDNGGSGTFYYALVAININGKYIGLKAVSLGDRIAPQSILIQNQVAMVNYADRNPGEAMSVSPSVGVTKYIVVNDNTVKEFDLLDKGEQLFVGNLIMSHEVRIFTPCGGTAHWIIGTSTAYAELTKAYTASKSTTSPYSSVYAVVSGLVVAAPTDGFGADYTYGIDIRNLLKIVPNGSCPKV